MVMPDGPMSAAVNNEGNDIMRQEFITYRVRHGYLVKETVTRVYENEPDSIRDYHDSSTTVVLHKV